MNVVIVNFPCTKVAEVEHRGSPKLEHETVHRLLEWRRQQRMPADKHRSYGVHYDNPHITLPQDYCVDFCVSVEQEIAPNAQGVVNKTIPGGRCAVLRHLGSRNNITTAAYLYQVWLPQSGETLRDFPLFFIMSMWVLICPSMR